MVEDTTYTLDEINYVLERVGTAIYLRNKIFRFLEEEKAIPYREMSEKEIIEEVFTRR